MWLFLSNSFLSIVDPKDGSNNLRVRARRPGDIERVFPGAVVKKTPGRDYLYRAHIERELVAQAIADNIMGINYNNFKDSVRDTDLHNACNSVWTVMARLQPIAPYSNQPHLFVEQD